MAYWMTHLRVAEALLRCLPEGISLPHYYAGSIAPDCGRTEWNEDGTPRYLPGRVVTHWLKKDEALDRCLIDFEGFYNAMMPQAADDGARAFYWGYYIHLITDAMWQERVLRPRRGNREKCLFSFYHAVKYGVNKCRECREKKTARRRSFGGRIN